MANWHLHCVERKNIDILHLMCVESGYTIAVLAVSINPFTTDAVKALHFAILVLNASNSSNLQHLVLKGLISMSLSVLKCPGHGVLPAQPGNLLTLANSAVCRCPLKADS